MKQNRGLLRVGAIHWTPLFFEKDVIYRKREKTHLLKGVILLACLWPVLLSVRTDPPCGFLQNLYESLIWTTVRHSPRPNLEIVPKNGEIAYFLLTRISPKQRSFIQSTLTQRVYHVSWKMYHVMWKIYVHASADEKRSRKTLRSNTKCYCYKLL